MCAIISRKQIHDYYCWRNGLSIFSVCMSGRTNMKSFIKRNSLQIKSHSNYLRRFENKSPRFLFDREQPSKVLKEALLLLFFSFRDGLIFGWYLQIEAKKVMEFCAHLSMIRLINRIRILITTKNHIQVLTKLRIQSKLLLWSVLYTETHAKLKLVIKEIRTHYLILFVQTWVNQRLI